MTRTVEELLQELKENGKVTIKGFGTFYVDIKKGREGVSAFNGKAWKTEDTKVIKFTQSSSLDVSDFNLKK